jgi:hypothetical protein
MFQTLKKAFLFALCILYVAGVFSQETENSRFLFQGQIISEEGRPIALAHIIDITSKTGLPAIH